MKAWWKHGVIIHLSIDGVKTKSSVLVSIFPVYVLSTLLWYWNRILSSILLHVASCVLYCCYQKRGNTVQQEVKLKLTVCITYGLACMVVDLACLDQCRIGWLLAVICPNSINLVELSRRVYLGLLEHSWFAEMRTQSNREEVLSTRFVK